MSMVRSNLSRVLAATVVVTAMLAATQANAAVITLSDQNSEVKIDPNSQSGMFSWTVDGVSQLFQQWFWYRIGSTGGESSIDTLDATPTEVSIDTDASGGDDFASITYTGTGLKVQVKYVLTGGLAGSHNSDVSEVITITNTGSTGIDLSFFQYSDFDLNGSPGGQTVNITGGNTARQGGNGFVLSETVVTPAPTHHEAATFSDTRDSLNDGNPTTLNDVNFASGDVTWAFQWDRTLGAGQSFIISKDKNLHQIPEPFSLGMWGIGLALTGLVSARRRAAKRS